MTITSTAAYQKIFSEDVRVGFFAAANELSVKLASGTLPPEKAAVAPQLIFNQHLDAFLTMFFVAVLWVVLIDMFRMCWKSINSQQVLPSSEEVYVQTVLQ